MQSPLTRQQESLRGRRVEDLTDEQLLIWLDACDKMMRWVKPAKARRTWKAGRERAEAEIATRQERAARRRDRAS